MHKGVTETLSSVMQKRTFALLKRHFNFESQQRDVAISMAREVASGQTVVLHQVEQRAETKMVEQAAQADRTATRYADAEQIF